MLTGCLFIVIKVIQKLLYSKKRSKLLLTLKICFQKTNQTVIEKVRFSFSELEVT